MENNTKKGFLLGALVGTGLGIALKVMVDRKRVCGIGFNNSHTNLKAFFHQLKWKMKKIGFTSKEKYDDLVTHLVSEYAAQKGLVEDNKNDLLNFFKGQWEMLRSKLNGTDDSSHGAQPHAPSEDMPWNTWPEHGSHRG